MTRSLSALSLCLLLAYSAFGQLAGDKSQLRFKGAVQTIRIEVCKISNKEGKTVENTHLLSSEYTLDVGGQLIESIIHNYDGSPYAKYRASYDDKGHKVEEAYYNPKGNLVDKMLYSYDANGRLIEKTVEKAKTSPKSKSTYTYDEKGRIIEKAHRDVKDSAGYNISYAYDSMQNRVEETAYDLKGSVKSKTIHKYDGQLRLTEREYELNQGHKLWKSSFTYDANGNVAEEAFTIFDAMTKWRYEYELDSNGNWTKRTTYSLVNRAGTLKFEPVETAYRTITYSTMKNESGQNHSMDVSSTIAIKETSSYLPANAVNRQEPAYPEDAKRQRLTGTVNVFVMVAENGEVVFARAAPEVAKSLREAATTAAWRWKLNPTVSGGIPLRFVGPLVFNFGL